MQFAQIGLVNIYLKEIVLKLYHNHVLLGLVDQSMYQICIKFCIKEREVDVLRFNLISSTELLLLLSIYVCMLECHQTFCHGKYYFAKIQLNS